MLDLPGLDVNICQQLSRRDLTKYARVNKEWNRNIIPHLWSDLTFLPNADERVKEALRRMVLEDYLGTHSHLPWRLQDDYLDVQRYRRLRSQAKGRSMVKESSS